MPGQFLDVPMPWGGEHIGIEFCPVCGTNIHGNDRCEHLLFVFLDEADEFTYVSNDILSLADQIGEFDPLSDDDHPTKQLTGWITNESAVCLHFGPNSTGAGISICIDFAA